MESKTELSNQDQTDSWNKSLKCWRTSSTGPECLRVETADEIHLFPYGYFQHAKFSCENEKDTIHIEFQGRVVMVTGHGLKPLCEALSKLSVEQIRTCPDKLTGFGKDEGVIEKIQISNRERVAKVGVP